MNKYKKYIINKVKVNYYSVFLVPIIYMIIQFILLNNLITLGNGFVKIEIELYVIVCFIVYSITFILLKFRQQFLNSFYLIKYFQENEKIYKLFTMFDPKEYPESIKWCSMYVNKQLLKLLFVFSLPSIGGLILFLLKGDIFSGVLLSLVSLYLFYESRVKNKFLEKLITANNE